MLLSPDEQLHVTVAQRFLGLGISPATECMNRNSGASLATTVALVLAFALILMPVTAGAAAFASFPNESRQGVIETISGFHSRNPAYDRDLWVYLPPSYAKEPSRRFPVLYAMDGQNVFDLPASKPGKNWRMDYEAEKAFAAGCAPEVIIVAVPSKETGDRRADEYRPDRHADAFLSFLVNEVKPAIDAKYRTLPDRKNTAMCGSSYGGLVSTWAAATYPGTFGQIAALSITADYCRGQLDRAFRSMPQHVRMYFDVGTDDMGDSPTAELRDWEAFMAAHGYTWGVDFITYLDSGGHHDPCFWSRRVPRILSFLFGPGSPPSVPAAVGKVDAQSGATSVFLSWPPVRGALTYDVSRSGVTGSAATVATAITTPYFLDSSLHTGESFNYRIIPVNGRGPGPASAEVIVTLSPTRDILIPNADFEIPQVGPGVHLFDLPDACWWFSADAGICSAGSYFTQKSPELPEGRQVAMVRRQGTLKQTVGGFKDGISYVLSLMAAQSGMGTVQHQTIKVILDDSVIGAFTPAGTNFVKFTTAPFMANAVEHELIIAGINPAGDSTALIDCVRISAPEKREVSNNRDHRRHPSR
jgi:Putative esterase